MEQRSVAYLTPLSVEAASAAEAQHGFCAELASTLSSRGFSTLRSVESDETGWAFTVEVAPGQPVRCIVDGDGSGKWFVVVRRAFPIWRLVGRGKSFAQAWATSVGRLTSRCKGERLQRASLGSMIENSEVVVQGARTRERPPNKCFQLTSGAWQDRSAARS
jgi:hypothetical protein